MHQEEIILEIRLLEQMLEDARKRAYSLRKSLERISAPAPSGEVKAIDKQILEILSKRKNHFQNKKDKPAK